VKAERASALPPAPTNPLPEIQGDQIFFFSDRLRHDTFFPWIDSLSYSGYPQRRFALTPHFPSPSFKRTWKAPGLFLRGSADSPTCSSFDRTSPFFFELWKAEFLLNVVFSCGFPNGLGRVPDAKFPIGRFPGKRRTVFQLQKDRRSFLILPFPQGGHTPTTVSFPSIVAHPSRPFRSKDLISLFLLRDLSRSDLFPFSPPLPIASVQGPCFPITFFFPSCFSRRINVQRLSFFPLLPSSKSQFFKVE